MVDPSIKSIPALQPRLKARLIVKDWVDKHTDVTDKALGIDPDKDIYVVWFAKTLQNWKALLSTNRLDGMYYEVTFNGDKDEAYLDAYKKFDNVTYSSEGMPHKLDEDCWCHPTIVTVPGK